MACDEMVMWLISDRDFVLNRVTVRLKNLVFFRLLEEPHKEVNASHEAHMGIYESTQQPELLSNEQTRIRVLDVPAVADPGFRKGGFRLCHTHFSHTLFFQ